MKEKIIFLLFLVSSLLAHSQSSIGDNPYFYMLAKKSMTMKNGKIDFTESKKIKGIKNPTTMYYTLIFSKDVSYATENRKINVHFFSEQDSILYIIDDRNSCLIDYKEKAITIYERNELIFMIRRNYPFAYFYSNQAGGNLFLMGTIKSTVKTDFSTIITSSEQKLFAGAYNLRPKRNIQNTASTYRLFCLDKYEFRNSDTLLSQYVTKINDPSHYRKGTIVEIENQLLSATMDDKEYENSFYYNYENFYRDGFRLYDKRKYLPTKNNQNISNTVLPSPILENKTGSILSSDFVELENEMMALYLQVKEGQLQMTAQQETWIDFAQNHRRGIKTDTAPTKSVESTPQQEMGNANAVNDIPVITSETAENTSSVESLENTSANKNTSPNTAAATNDPFFEQSIEDMFAMTPVAELKTEWIVIEDIIVDYIPSTDQPYKPALADLKTDVPTSSQRPVSEQPVSEVPAEPKQEIKPEVAPSEVFAPEMVVVPTEEIKTDAVLPSFPVFEGPLIAIEDVSVKIILLKELTSAKAMMPVDDVKVELVLLNYTAERK